MEIISLKLEEGLLKDIDSNLKKHRYSTRTEFIRGAIRNQLTKEEKDDAIRKLIAFKGSLKGKARMSDEKAARLADIEIAKKFGINLD